MSSIPSKYSYLLVDDVPLMIKEAVKLYGTLEGAGARDNPAILAWAKALGLSQSYSHDEVPWCGLFMGYVGKLAGKKIPDTPLWALAWKSFGTPVSLPMLGDVMVKSRAGGGHVTLYIGEDADCYHCLGGNQGDAVTIARYPKNLGWYFRRPLYKVQPSTVRRVYLDGSGPSTNTKES